LIRQSRMANSATMMLPTERDLCLDARTPGSAVVRRACAAILS